MKVSEAVQHMTKQYLHRIIDSFTKDITKPDVERSREIVVRNAEELTDARRIRTVLSREELFSQQLLESYILEALINRPEYAATEEELIEEVRALEQHVLDEAREPDALKYTDARAVDVLRAVLEVALEDDQVSSEELSLLRRLRHKLEIHEKTKRIVLAELGYFPRQGNRLHEPSDFRDVLIDLQKRGVVFYCNRLDGGRYVLPEELVDGVKAALGLEMSRVGWTKLLEHLTKEQLPRSWRRPGCRSRATRRSSRSGSGWRALRRPSPSTR